MHISNPSPLFIDIPPIDGRLFIAYSGGVDSHVLLHLCARQEALRDKLVAVYVHHGLQAVADAWGEHCRHQAQALGVAFMQLDVDARAAVGESPEAAAREARYRALKSLLAPGDVVALAQHREDQMETLLLQLFRGAGVAGLAAMPRSTRFGKGLMIRPLLATGKQAILDYAVQHGLDWVEDPSNHSSDFDRNFLRHHIVPVLKQRWPSLDKTVARSARHCASAQHVIDEWARQALIDLISATDRSLSLDALTVFSPEQRDYLLRAWLKGFGLQAPSQSVLDALVEQLINARDEADPSLSLHGHQLRRYRRRLYCVELRCLVPMTEALVWPGEIEGLQLDNGACLQRLPAKRGIPQRLWHASHVSVRPRQGGEKFKLAGRSGHHALKTLYQDAGIPPWERETRPLIYIDDRLAAVAGLWVAEWAWSDGVDACYDLKYGYAGHFD